MNKAQAGRLGGLKTVQRYGKHYMKQLGVWGAHVTHSRYRLEPVDLNDFAMVNKETNQVKAFLSGKPVKGDLYVVSNGNSS